MECKLIAVDLPDTKGALVQYVPYENVAKLYDIFLTTNEYH